MLSYSDLLEDWIIYLKSKGIVKKQSNPDGSLSYQRQPEATDLTSFLINSGFERPAIRNAFKSVEKEEPAQDTAQAVDSTTDTPVPDQSLGAEVQEPEQAQSPEAPKNIQPEVGAVVEFPGVRNVKFQWNGKQWKLINLKSGKASKIANREVANVLTKMSKGIDPEMKELLDARKKLKLFASMAYTGNILSEDFKSSTYSEQEIKAIFKFLTKEEKPEEVEQSPEELEDRKTMEINKIKQSIRDKFTDKQRIALWRILSNA